MKRAKCQNEKVNKTSYEFMVFCVLDLSPFWLRYALKLFVPFISMLLQCNRWLSQRQCVSCGTISLNILISVLSPNSKQAKPVRFTCVLKVNYYAMPITTIAVVLFLLIRSVYKPKLLTMFCKWCIIFDVSFITFAEIIRTEWDYRYWILWIKESHVPCFYFKLEWCIAIRAIF